MLHPMDAYGLAGAVASIATFGGFAYGGLQLRMARSLVSAQFEQQFNERYRLVIARVPLESMLGESSVYDPSNDAQQQVRRAFYDYFELCEEQLFYKDSGKVSNSTWNEWRVGIESNFMLPAFRSAWEDLSAACPEQFSNLRILIDEFQLSDHKRFAGMD